MLHIAYFEFMAKQTVYPIKKLVNLTEEQASRIADFRFAQRLQSENEAIRRLIEIGLGASAKSNGEDRA